MSNKQLISTFLVFASVTLNGPAAISAIAGPPPCVEVVCNPDKTFEFEFNCGLPVDVVNGGCNSAPPVFSSISCGEAVCGTGAFDGATRDTDWREITIPVASNITWTVTAEFDVLTFILDATNCPAVQLTPGGLGGPCDTVTLTSDCLDVGTYVLFVAPQFTAIFDCVEGLKYNGMATCEPCVLPPPCPTDTNNDGVTNVLDLIDLLLCFGLPAVPGCEAEDVNQDGSVDVLDLIDLLLEFGLPCA